MMFRHVQKLLLGGLLALASSWVCSANYGVFEDHPYEFTVSKTISNTAEFYHMATPGPSSGKTGYEPTYPGQVKKSAFRIRTNYDLSNADGWQATGITRLLSIGSFNQPTAIDIDIYDTRGVAIGTIYGNILTVESAKYSIYSYDEAGRSELLAYAVANADFTHFAIHTAKNSLAIAEMTRNREANTWSMVVVTPNKIDDRIIRIFAGFVVDYQDKFLAETAAETPVDSE